MYAVFKSAPSSLQAEYIIGRYVHSLQENPQSSPGFITKALRYPICTETVLEAIFRMPNCPKISEKSHIELPRRLFRTMTPRTSTRRSWTRDDHPLPFLRYLYQHPRIPTPHSDSWEGYPLTKAVASKFIPLVQFLLEKGASPALKDGIAVRVAIRLKDLALVKMLIEPTDPSTACSSRSKSEGIQEPSRRVEIRRKRLTETEHETNKSAKKRRLEDRVEVSQEMLQTAVACNARDIVEYFMHEKSCMPDMQTVKLINTERAAAVTGSSGERRKQRTRRH